MRIFGLFILVIAFVALHGCDSERRAYKRFQKFKKNNSEYFEEKDTVLKFVDKGLQVDTFFINNTVYTSSEITHVDTLYKDSTIEVITHRTVTNFLDKVRVRDSVILKVKEKDSIVEVRVPQTIINEPPKPIGFLGILMVGLMALIVLGFIYVMVTNKS